MTSALYAGTVVHQRCRPKRHRLRYRLAQGLFDLDELDETARRLRFFSRNRFNLFAFHDRDYGDGTATPLRDQIETHLRNAGLDPDGGPIRLLAMPRVLGHVFNPIAIWFCHRRDGSLLAIVYEVTNTLKQRHLYLIPVTEGAEEDGAIRQSCAKTLYVSPFMDMDMAYDFAIRPPGETVQIVVNGKDEGGPLISASFAGKRRALTDRALLRLFFTIPLVTLKTVAGIHWEALKLWLKGIRIRKAPAPPEAKVTLGR
ncbi:MAG TPA: DUF1365 family protein [Allosphingosinicella sp.]|nr:DUF1365 family protein [Allosphingosinicella sp.]